MTKTSVFFQLPAVLDHHQKLREHLEGKQVCGSVLCNWITMKSQDNWVCLKLGDPPKIGVLTEKKDNQSSTAMQWMFNVGPLRPLVANF